eukprot:4776455-Pyramimonas_sp.AAC.1
MVDMMAKMTTVCSATTSTTLPSETATRRFSGKACKQPLPTKTTPTVASPTQPPQQDVQMTDPDT